MIMILARQCVSTAALCALCGFRIFQQHLTTEYAEIQPTEVAENTKSKLTHYT